MNSVTQGTVYLILIQILLKNHSSGGCSWLFSNMRLLISWHLLVLCLQEGSLPRAQGRTPVYAAFSLFL